MAGPRLYAARASCAESEGLARLCGVFRVGRRLIWVVRACAVALPLAGTAGCGILTADREPLLGATSRPIAYPDLSSVPARPVASATAEEKDEVVRSLAADRALTAQAGESLRREIETSFSTPTPER